LPQSPLDLAIDEWIQNERELEERESRTKSKGKGKEKKQPSTMEAIRTRQKMTQTLRERGELPGHWEGEGSSAQEAGQDADDFEDESEAEEPRQVKKNKEGASFGPPRRTLDRLLKAYGENQDKLKEVFVQVSADYTRELRELKEVEKQRLAVDQQKAEAETKKAEAEVRKADAEVRKAEAETRKADALERLIDRLESSNC
jgi:hypothetical protein